MPGPDKKGELKMLEAMSFVWDVVVIIALPTTLLALGGRWLDKRLESSPWFTLLGLALALGIVYLMISRKAKDIAKRISDKPQ
jgi:LPXTG-motif cell wall-anchored protein